MILCTSDPAMELHMRNQFPHEDFTVICDPERFAECQGIQVQVAVDIPFFKGIDIKSFVQNLQPPCVLSVFGPRASLRLIEPHIERFNPTLTVQFIPC